VYLGLVIKLLVLVGALGKKDAGETPDTQVTINFLATRLLCMSYDA
jgi:hypothetical protein